MFYTTSYTFPKLSILLFYRRIFPDQKFHKACYCVMAFVITANTVLLFLVIFQCVSSQIVPIPRPPCLPILRIRLRTDLS